MSIATEISRLQGAKASLKTSIENKGVTVPSATTIDGYAALVDSIQTGGGTGGTQVTLEVTPTEVRYDATHTENVASSDYIKIRGNDGNDYTVAQWNAMFVDAGYNKDNMTVEPLGLRVTAFETDEVFLFDICSDEVYDVSGNNKFNKRCLQHSMYNYVPITATASGTDATTNKAWSVTESGDNYVLYEENTKQSWIIKKGMGFFGIHKLDPSIASSYVYSIYAVTEWLRHRMAIDSGITTTKENGTTGEIQILNSNGVQAAANEDMYFWVKDDLGTLVKTTYLAKYNLNNRHPSGANLTQTIADAIYTAQKNNGINMNDTGVNSASKPILCTGAKGAEVIAVDGKWMIITPYISYPSAALGVTQNLSDSQAIYWAIANNCTLPTDRLLWAMYVNLNIVNGVVDYLKNREGWTMPTIASNFWCLQRTVGTNALMVNPAGGIHTQMYTFHNAYVVAGSKIV